ARSRERGAGDRPHERLTRATGTARPEPPARRAPRETAVQTRPARPNRGAVGRRDDQQASTAHWLEGAGPPLELVERGGRGRPVVLAGRELAEVLEVGHQREAELLAHVGDLQLAAHPAQVLDRACAA